MSNTPLPITALTGDPVPVPTPLDTLAAKLYPPAPAPYKPEPVAPAVAAVRAADATARLLYEPSKQYRTQEWALATHPGATPTVLEAQRVELAELATDLGLNQSDVDRFASLAATHMANPPTQRQQQADELAALKQLREVYGKDASEALAAGKALAQRDPRFAKYLAASKLGSSPAVVLKLAELGLSARNRSR
jgi:hypothetical protein